MVDSAGYALWAICTFVEGLVCVLIVLRGQLRKHLALWSYFALCIVVSGFRFHVLLQSGLTSSQYLYAYCFTEVGLTIALYLAVLEPYHRMFPAPRTQFWLRVMKCGGAGLAAFWSLSVVAGHGSRITAGFLIEFSENLVWLTALFALGLLYPRLWDRRVPVHVYQLVFLLAAFYTFYISLFAVRTLF